MNLKLILIFSILIIIINWKSMCENFDILSDKDQTETNQKYKSNIDKTIPKYQSELSYQPVNKLSCCLVEKKYLPDNTNQLGGSFKYKFKKLENENCDLKLFRLDSNKQLFFDGENSWSNEFCSNDNKKIGSCRFVNKECIDFVTPDFCKKYNMTWSEKSCHDPLNYQWEDKINLKLPRLKDNGKIIIFNKKSDLSK
jgi:hypothetical protein